MEIWKDIPDYEGLYQVSSQGRIRNNKKIRKLTLRKDGYLHIPLSKNGVTKYFLIHQLVAKTFIDNPLNYKEINHIDENKTNNIIENLEWCSRSYNINYGLGNIKRAKTEGKKINQFTKDGAFIQQWDTIKQASKELNIKLPHIIRVLKGRRKSTGGFVFKYVMEV